MVVPKTERASRSAASRRPAAEAAAYQPMAEHVADAIRKEIFSGQLRPGEPIRQAAFADKLGTSRIPVREALRHLESEGLITIRPHSGARVAVLDYDECLELYKIRERLEPLAFGESVNRVEAAQIDDLDTLVHTIEQLTGDHPSWIEADRDFHLACYQASGLPRLLRAIETYWNTTQQYRRIVLSTFSPGDFVCYQGEHRLMIDAMRTRNARAGEDVVRMHLERSRMRLAASPELFG